MKKFLSLVLALVMAMSLVTISAGAKDFTDSADVNYAAAIDVMSELKVIDGYTDGSFRPATELNRGAAAKIICNMILGPTTASALSASSAPFADVPADSVFAGYITYCAKEGIISGYADGTFRPTAPLTGYAFAKMLLGALGYDADLEGYTGANWSVNVAKQAIGIGLDDGIDGFVGTAYVNRETACQLALNTLQATMVEYDSKTSVTVNGAEVVVGGSEAKEVAVAASVVESFENDNKLQFAEKYFTNLKVQDAEDAFGRPAKEWKIKNKSVGVFADKADLTYTVAMKGKEVYADLGADIVDFDVYEDGVDNSTAYSAVVFDKKGAGTSNKVGHQGALTEVFYDADAETARIVTINTYIMQATEDYDADDESLALEDVTGSYCPLATATVYSEDIAGLEGFVEEDYVLVTIADGVIKSVAAVEPVAVVIDEHVYTESVTADGAEYKFAYAWETAAASENYAVDSEYELYFDTYGNIIFSEAVEADKVYAYVDEFAATSLMSVNAKVDGYLYFADGSEDEVRVNKVDGDKVKAGDISGLDIKEWYTFTEKEGVYELKSVTNVIGDAFSADEAIIDEDTLGVMINVDGTKIRGNKETQFVIVDADGDVSVYTGIKKAPQVLAATDTYVAAVADVNNYAEYVFIALGAGKMDGVADSSDLILVIDYEKEGTDAADNDYYRFKALLNGEAGKVRAELVMNGGDSYNGKLFSSVEYDAETGYVSGWHEVDGSEDDYDMVSGSFTLTQKGNVIGAADALDDYKFYMADDAVIYVVDLSDADVETVSAKTLCKTVSGVSATFYSVLDKNDDVVALYVVKA